MKALIKNNRRILRNWLIIALTCTVFSAFMIFYKFKDEPKKQNIKTFIACIVLIASGFASMMYITRTFYDKEKKYYYTNGDLCGNAKRITDVVGLGCITMIVGVWWENASLIFAAIPIYLFYVLVHMLFNWLRY